MSSPNPARDPKGPLPPGAVASQRSEGLADQRAVVGSAPCPCGGAVEVKRANIELWACRCGRVRVVEDMDVGADVPGGGAA